MTTNGRQALINGGISALALRDRVQLANQTDMVLDQLMVGQGVGSTPIEEAKKQIATGTYTGNGAAGRQITVGFKCSCVIIQGVTNVTRHTLVPLMTVQDAIDTVTEDNVNDTVNCYLHATDGFVVSNVGWSNNAGLTYYYFAISE